MAQFVFRFQPVLSIKKQMEDSTKNELGKAVRKFEGEKEELRLIELNRQECINEMKQYASDSIDVISLKKCNTFLWHIRDCINVQKENVVFAEGKVEDCRKDLINAVKERKTLDTLKEKQIYQFSRQQLLKEQKQIDEVAGYSYNKKAYGRD